MLCLSDLPNVSLWLSRSPNALYALDFRGQRHSQKLRLAVARATWTIFKGVHRYRTGKSSSMSRTEFPRQFLKTCICLVENSPANPAVPSVIMTRRA